jgi:hypothetical protein
VSPKILKDPPHNRFDRSSVGPHAVTLIAKATGRETFMSNIKDDDVRRDVLDRLVLKPRMKQSARDAGFIPGRNRAFLASAAISA